MKRHLDAFPINPKQRLQCWKQQYDPNKNTHHIRGDKMSIKPILIGLAILLSLGIFGVVANPQYNMSDVTLLNLFVACLVLGIPLFLIVNWHRILHQLQYKKRMELLKTHGHYQTIVTKDFKMGRLITPETEIYYHKMLNCPFLFKPHGGKLISKPESLEGAYPCECVEWVDRKTQL